MVDQNKRLKKNQKERERYWSKKASPNSQSRDGLCTTIRQETNATQHQPRTTMQTPQKKKRSQMQLSQYTDTVTDAEMVECSSKGWSSPGGSIRNRNNQEMRSVSQHSPEHRHVSTPGNFRPTSISDTQPPSITTMSKAIATSFTN